MYGTLGRMQVKPGKLDDLLAHLRDPRMAAMPGHRGTYVLVAEGESEIALAVMYESKDAYVAMVHDPATEANYPKLLEHLAAEPEWTDGEWVAGA
ncbi:MAG TPA: antibiotic biosynthesis monooxygenase [Actinomycetota bacterium]|nr:antibiotic biosynthesis monooxygenase [Actinomycetota bacterium]